jgi:hypothetical protein
MKPRFFASAAASLRMTQPETYFHQRVLGLTVAPVDPAQVAVLVRQHEALRTRLGITVAPLDAAQIATPVR